MTVNYDQMTDDEFYEILADLVVKNSGSLLEIPGVYEVVSEHFNNDVLACWAEANPVKAGACPECEEFECECEGTS
uniref:Uncharacterized protein n=1 Tax=viral metagenome TaxID=1070528 RepID=A0A6M3M065_9ZZZZ